MTNRAVDAENRKGLARLGSILLHELRLVIPPTVFFFFGFNLILLTKRLFLADYLIAYAVAFRRIYSIESGSKEKISERSSLQLHTIEAT